jgi:hypothetical protein
VISGSPVDIWAAKGYGTSHSQETLRKQHGIKEEDIVVLVVGSYLFFDELPWDYATVLRASAPHIIDIARTKKLGVQFILFCGNGTDAYNSAFQVLIIFKFYRTLGEMPCVLENSYIVLDCKGLLKYLTEGAR